MRWRPRGRSEREVPAALRRVPRAEWWCSPFPGGGSGGARGRGGRGKFDERHRARITTEVLADEAGDRAVVEQTLDDAVEDRLLGAALRIDRAVLLAGRDL